VIRVYCRSIPAEKCCGLGSWENRGHEKQNCYGGVCRIDASNEVDKDKACVDAGGWFEDGEGQTCAEEFRSINRLLAEGPKCSDKLPWGGQAIQEEVNGKMGWIKDQCCSESAYKCSGGSSSICKVPSKQAPVREVRCGDTTPELCCKSGGAWQEEHQHPGSNSACSSSSTTKGPMGYCRLNIWNFNPESDLQTMCTDTLKGRIDSAGDCNDHHWWKYSNGNCSAVHKDFGEWEYDGKKFSHTVTSHNWHNAKQCCSSGGMACEPPERLGGIICKNPQSFKPEFATEMSCQGLNASQCCRIGGGMKQRGDYGSCGRASDNNAKFPIKPD